MFKGTLKGFVQESSWRNRPREIYCTNTGSSWPSVPAFLRIWRKMQAWKVIKTSVKIFQMWPKGKWKCRLLLTVKRQLRKQPCFTPIYPRPTLPSRQNKREGHHTKRGTSVKLKIHTNNDCIATHWCWNKHDNTRYTRKSIAVFRSLTHAKRSRVNQF